MFVRLLLLGERICIAVARFRCALDNLDSLWVYRNWTKCEIRRVLIDSSPSTAAMVFLPGCDCTDDWR